MPIIPLLKPTATPDAPTLARDNLRRPTADTSGVQQAMLQANAANRNEMLDARDFVKPWEAVETIGRAIARTGSIVGAAAAKEEEALGIKQYGDFRAQYTNERTAFEAERDKLAPEKWSENWQGRLKNLQTSIEGRKDLTRSGRERITQFLTVEGAESVRGVADESRRRINRQAADVLQADIAQAITDQNSERFEALVQQSENAFYQTKYDSFRQREEFKAYGLRKGEEEARAQLGIAVQLGDESKLEAALQVGKDKAGWSDTVVHEKRLAGQDAIKQTIEANRNAAEAEFLGQVYLRKAQGEKFVPAQADAWVKEGKVDAGTGARLRVTFQSDVGAMTGEFHDFLIDRVDSYNPIKDPLREGEVRIRQEAELLGMNDLQRNLFEFRLQRATKLNGPERAQQAVLTAGKKMIAEGLKDLGRVRTWDEDAATLFKTPSKLELFGIPKEAANEIQKKVEGGKSWGGLGSPNGEGIDPAKALSIFRDNAKTRATVRPPGLTEKEWNKLVALAEGDTTISPAAQGDTEFDRAFLEEGLESWYEAKRLKEGKPPTDIEVKTWVGEKTRAVLQGTGAVNIFKVEEPARPLISDVPEAKASAKPLGGDLISRVKEFESFSEKAYDDFAQISIGYGTEAQSINDTITEEEATAALKTELTASARRVDAAARRYKVELTENQRNALISFDFNTGDAPRVLERTGGDLSKAPAIMAEWRNVTKDGRKTPLDGLIKRRKAEGEWFNTP